MARVRPRSQLIAVIRYTLQSCLPPRRWAAVLLPCVGAVAFGLLSRGLFGGPDARFANVAAEAIFSLTMPITALVVGDAVLGAEVRAGTFHFTWLSPTRFWRIVAGRWIGGALVVTVTVGPACVLAALVAGAPGSAGAAFIAGVTGAIAYVAVFIAVGCITRRTAVWSLAIVFLVERLLGAALTGIAQISPTWLSRSTFVGLLDDPPERLVREGIPDGWGAVVRLAVVTAIALAIAVWRMGRMRLSGATD
jgi:ABC-type transport system involved in multi-copper enzyme maturation permease subunit